MKRPATYTISSVFASLALATSVAAGTVRLDNGAMESTAVSVQIIEDVDQPSWPPDSDRVTTEFTRPMFALSGLPHKYSSQSIRVDRSEAFVVRLSGKILLPAGRHVMLLRSMNSARVLVDDRPMARTRFIRRNADGHESVPDVPKAHVRGMRQLPVGHAEQLFTLETDGGSHEVVVETFVGGKKLRPELGELSLSLQREDEMFYVLGPHPEHTVPLTNAGWSRYAEASRARLISENQRRRQLAGHVEDEYWTQRHARARQFIAANSTPEIPAESLPANNAIDHFINQRLIDNKLSPRALTNDLEFLRRVTLDTVGVIPSADEIAIFMADDDSVRRRNAISRLTDDPRWADHWVAYWQDVLAENPGILKPKINNTGPFRFWIHESFLDNKPIDRFVTELVMMQGSKYQGGPAGFGLATQNDVPMGAKAQIVAQAFLAVDMKCARCHDAPFQDVQQHDLFSMAAMLKRAPQEVPASSSIPLPAEEIEDLAVEVNLTPGSAVNPSWPFHELLPGEIELVAGIARNPDDTRERLAALITSPENQRFPRVVVNRLWQRYLGRGLVDSVDDWDMASPSHPELLAFLADQLAGHDYDLKHVARLIFNSRAYQRQPAQGEAAAWFAGPARRRLTAEQIVDSFFELSGKPVGSEPLTLDLDGRRDITAFLNLGVPTRAWQFTSLSNERDRPALAMPRAQSIVDVLENFGWRSSRQNPLTIRAEESTIQQPAILANGVLARRISGLSDDSRLTTACLQATNVNGLIDDLFMRTLTRLPNDVERDVFRELLSPGFGERVVAVDVDPHRTPSRLHAVSWSNHLSAEATRIKLEMERLARAGDPPTRKLSDDWRERAEDAIWSLTNSPEFIFSP